MIFLQILGLSVVFLLGSVAVSYLQCQPLLNWQWPRLTDRKIKITSPWKYFMTSHLIHQGKCMDGGLRHLKMKPSHLLWDFLLPYFKTVPVTVYDAPQRSGISPHHNSHSKFLPYDHCPELQLVNENQANLRKSCNNQTNNAIKIPRKWTKIYG